MSNALTYPAAGELVDTSKNLFFKLNSVSFYCNFTHATGNPTTTSPVSEREAIFYQLSSTAESLKVRSGINVGRTYAPYYTTHQ